MSIIGTVTRGYTMLMTTELYERMNALCDARVMFDDEQYELEQAVFAAITAVNQAEKLLELYEKRVLTDVA